MSGRVVLVTGAARGVGRAVAIRFATLGDCLALGDVDVAGLEATGGEARGAGGDVLVRPTDVSRSADCEGLVGAAVARWGRLDVLVNNAGIGLWGPLTELTDGDWQRVIGVNLSGVMFCTRAALRVMLPRGHGHIVTISSDLGRVAGANFAAYSASKFGVSGLTHAAAAEARPHGVRVSLLYPGIIDTRFREAQRDRPAETVPERSRMLTAADVADAVVWIAGTPPTALAAEVVLDPAR